MNRMTFLHPLRHKPQTRWLLLLALLLLLGFGAALAVSRPGLASERTPAGGDQYAYLPFVPYEPVVPPPDTLSLVPFADGFSTTTITDIANAGDTRLFVLEREGVIRVVLANGTILPTPFLDIRDLVETSNWEQGLVGIAFHPHYSQNGYFYITFTERQLGLNNIRLYRFSVSADPNVADRGSAVRMMSIERPEQVHHAGDLNLVPMATSTWAWAMAAPTRCRPMTPMPSLATCTIAARTWPCPWAASCASMWTPRPAARPIVAWARSTPCRRAIPLSMDQVATVMKSGPMASATRGVSALTG